jgi:hypothetical protein
MLSHFCPDGFTYTISSLHCGDDALSRGDGSAWARWANIAHPSLGNQKLESFKTSKTDHHLLRQKHRQRVSVMKTNTLYVSRELAF